MRVLVAIGAAALIAGIAGCAPANDHAESVTVTDVVTLTRSPSPSPAPVATGPLDSRPLTRADGPCPFIDEAKSVADVGMRMARQAVISRGGEPVGCDFYADQNWAQSEHLPGPNQPVLEIISSRHANATAAFNAMVRVSESGTQAHQSNLVNGQVGISYRTKFDPADTAGDWAYVYSVGPTLITVVTAQTASELNPREVAADLIGKF